MTSLLFIRYFIGCLIVGPVCDKLGRKWPLFISSIMMTCFGLLCSYMPEFYSFCFMRMFEGAAIGISIVSMTVY